MIDSVILGLIGYSIMQPLMHILSWVDLWWRKQDRKKWSLIVSALNKDCRIVFVASESKLLMGKNVNDSICHWMIQAAGSVRCMKYVRIYCTSKLLINEVVPQVIYRSVHVCKLARGLGCVAHMCVALWDLLWCNQKAKEACSQLPAEIKYTVLNCLISIIGTPQHNSWSLGLFLWHYVGHLD